MSGDNLHGNQPIKFYSEEITLTKVELLEKQLSPVSYTHLTLPTMYTV